MAKVNLFLAVANFILISFLVIPPAYGQEIIIQGHILDEQGNPLPWSNVAIKNKAKGSFCDESGFFKLNASPTDTLVITSIGYENYWIAATKFFEKINLKPSVTVLKEIQVKSTRTNQIQLEFGYHKTKDWTLAHSGRTQYAVFIPNMTGKDGTGAFQKDAVKRPF